MYSIENLFCGVCGHLKSYIEETNGLGFFLNYFFLIIISAFQGQDGQKNQL